METWPGKLLAVISRLSGSHFLKQVQFKQGIMFPPATKLTSLLFVHWLLVFRNH